MSEHWTTLQLHHIVSWDQQRLGNTEWHQVSEQLIRDLVSPVIVECDNRQLITSFHFLFEPQLLFRLRCVSEEARSEVKELIIRQFRAVSSIVRELAVTFNDDYHGKGDSYGGEENWLVMEKFLEASSRFFMRIKIPRIDRGSNFTQWKFMHVFLNCNNHIPPLEEGRAMVNLNCARMRYWNVNVEQSRRLINSFFDELWSRWGEV
jgi:hypothetical protein